MFSVALCSAFFRFYQFCTGCTIPNRLSLQKHDLELLLRCSLIQLLINVATKDITVFSICGRYG